MNNLITAAQLLVNKKSNKIITRKGFGDIFGFRLLLLYELGDFVRLMVLKRVLNLLHQDIKLMVFKRMISVLYNSYFEDLYKH